VKKNKTKDMKKKTILFTAARYHTNQIPIVKGLQEKGFSVNYLVHYKGEVEDYSLLTPELLKESLISRFLRSLRNIGRKSSDSLKENLFIPSLWTTIQQIKRIHPDIVVIRNRVILSLIVTMACRILNIKKLVLYTQTPLNSNSHLSVKKKMYYKFFPQVRMTPVLNVRHYQEQYKECKIWKHDYFIPLIFNLPLNNKEKTYFDKDIINIVCIGKYRAYKNHVLLVQAISLLSQKERNKIHIEIIGQDISKEEHEYRRKLEELIVQLSLTETFTLYRNRPYSMMPEVYKKNDVLILPSRLETAGMVILESMAYGLCTISSDNCGLATYITDAQAGMTFDYSSAESLSQVLSSFILNRRMVKEYGQNGEKYVKDKLSFSAYFSRFQTMIEKEFSYQL